MTSCLSLHKEGNKPMAYNEERILVLVIHEGVLGLGTRTPYGCDAVYYVEGTGYEVQLEPDEFVVWGSVEDIEPEIIDFYNL